LKYFFDYANESKDNAIFESCVSVAILLSSGQ
jgi:hypothetical protein